MTVAMYGLLDKGEWTFGELRNACIPSATLLANRLNGAYAYIVISLVAALFNLAYSRSAKAIKKLQVVSSPAKHCIGIDSHLVSHYTTGNGTKGITTSMKCVALSP